MLLVRGLDLLKEDFTKAENVAQRIAKIVLRVCDQLSEVTARCRTACFLRRSLVFVNVMKWVTGAATERFNALDQDGG